MLIRATRSLIIPCLTVGLALLFVYSGTSKVMAPRLFLSAVSGYQLFSARFSAFVASVVPWLEIVFGACLLTGSLATGALLGIIALLTVDAGAIGFALYRHLQIGCGCFALANEPVVSYLTEIRTLAILTAAIFLFVYHYMTSSELSEQQINPYATPRRN